MNLRLFPNNKRNENNKLSISKFQTILQSMKKYKDKKERSNRIIILISSSTFKSILVKVDWFNHKLITGHAQDLVETITIIHFSYFKQLKFFHNLEIINLNEN